MLNLKSEAEWRQFCKSGKKPKNIPFAPAHTYKNKGWLSWGNWLGTGFVADQLKEYRTFLEAREYAHSLKLKSGAEWYQFCKSGKKPKDIPAYPNQTYKKKGWIGVGDWLGKK